MVLARTGVSLHRIKIVPARWKEQRFRIPPLRPPRDYHIRRRYTPVGPPLGIQQTPSRDRYQFPPTKRANLQGFVDQIDYAVRKVGIDHVGISSDFDGTGGIDVWDNAAEAFNATLELVRRRYTETQIERLWSGNLLPVWGEVEEAANRLQKDGPPHQ